MLAPAGGTRGRPAERASGDFFTGSQAICPAEALQPDILRLDIRMPGVSGLEALPKIQAKSPQTKVLILPGLSGEESEKVNGGHSAAHLGEILTERESATSSCGRPEG